jgi:hypothetical protein
MTKTERITPDVARERCKHAAATARARVHRARMLAAHGREQEAREASVLATESVVEVRFYRARARGATLPEAGRHALAYMWPEMEGVRL